MRTQVVMWEVAMLKAVTKKKLMKKWTMDINHLLKFTMKGITGRREFSWKDDRSKNYLLRPGEPGSLPRAVHFTGPALCASLVMPFPTGGKMKEQRRHTHPESLTPCLAWSHNLDTRIPSLNDLKGLSRAREDLFLWSKILMAALND